jgi:hypothetical protein
MKGNDKTERQQKYQRKEAIEPRREIAPVVVSWCFLSNTKQNKRFQPNGGNFLKKIQISL